MHHPYISFSHNPPPHPTHQLKHDFRVRLGLPSPSSTSATSITTPSSKPDPSIYTTGPRRARTLGRVLAHGYLVTPEGEGEGRAVTKVVLRPVTGRRHQLRVHALYMGHPIGGWVEWLVGGQGVLCVFMIR